MNKINLKKQIVTLGRPVVDQDGNPMLMNQEIAFHLNSMNTTNPIKNNSICLRIYEKGELELDDSDFQFLKENVLSCRTAPDYLRTQVLKEMEENVKQAK